MQNFTPWSALSGGILIGIAVITLYLLTGQLAGISGILGSSLTRRPAVWKLLFIAGLPLGGAIFILISGGVPQTTISTPPTALIIAGLLVGYGTRLGNGCTSGHGICGLARLSARSLVATLLFMFTGMLTVYLINTLGGPF